MALADAVSTAMVKSAMSINIDPEPTAWFLADKIVEWGLYWHLEPETERVLIAPVYGNHG